MTTGSGCKTGIVTGEGCTTGITTGTIENVNIEFQIALTFSLANSNDLTISSIKFVGGDPSLGFFAGGKKPGSPSSSPDVDVSGFVLSPPPAFSPPPGTFVSGISSLSSSSI